jgi:hypothetical protein
MNNRVGFGECRSVQSLRSGLNARNATASRHSPNSRFPPIPAVLPEFFCLPA